MINGIAEAKDKHKYYYQRIDSKKKDANCRRKSPKKNKQKIFKLINNFTGTAKKCFKNTNTNTNTDFLTIVLRIKAKNERTLSINHTSDITKKRGSVFEICVNQ